MHRHSNPIDIHKIYWLGIVQKRIKKASISQSFWGEGGWGYALDGETPSRDINPLPLRASWLKTQFTACIIFHGYNNVVT